MISAELKRGRTRGQANNVETGLGERNENVMIIELKFLFLIFHLEMEE
jgi:hypothetical protein